MRYWVLIFVSALSNVFALDHSHRAWNNLLASYVHVQANQTLVDYHLWKQKPQELNQYLIDLSGVTDGEFKNFSDSEQLSFLINAYNAFTIKLILDNYPVSSIKKIGSFFKGPWDQAFFMLLGQKRSLNWIEHDIIRKKYREPRVHFALVCASIGCPNLRKEAFVPSNLNEQLADQEKTFLQDASKNRYLAEQKTIDVSSIFKWYGQDFGDEKALKAYLMDKLAPQEKQNVITLSFRSYDWSLNAWKK